MFHTRTLETPGNDVLYGSFISPGPEFSWTGFTKEQPYHWHCPIEVRHFVGNFARDRKRLPSIHTG